MASIKSFSVKWKRNMFCLELLCLAPRGKEKIIKLYLTPAMLESLDASLKKAMRNYKKKIPPGEDIRYIG